MVTRVERLCRERSPEEIEKERAGNDKAGTNVRGSGQTH